MEVSILRPADHFYFVYLVSTFGQVIALPKESYKFQFCGVGPVCVWLGFQGITNGWPFTKPFIPPAKIDFHRTILCYQMKKKSCAGEYICVNT